MYLFTYDYAQPWMDNKKNVNVEDAVAIWDTMLKNKCNFLEKWSTFCQAKKDSGKMNVISKDVWNMLWEFIDANGGDLSKSEDDGSWPVLIEEFCYD